MSQVEDLAREFLSHRKLAVVGVSEKEGAANLISKTLQKKGYVVYPVNPHLEKFDGEPCFPNLTALPDRPDGVIIVTTPAVAERIVEEAIAKGIRRIWMHGALGTTPRLFSGVAKSITSVSPKAMQRCRESGVTVIPGSCPMQFIGDPGHRCMRAVLRLTGAMKVPA